MLVRVSIVCIQVIFVTWCAAQQTPATYSVEGTVENSLTHQPIARALVESNNGGAVLTDGDGHFELQLPAGTIQFAVRRPGYQAGGSGESGSRRLVAVGPSAPPLTLYLTPAASITGHIVLSSGDEASEFHLQFYRRGVMEGHSRWMQQGGTETGSDGAFRLVSLDAPASYVLCSMPDPDRLRNTLRAAADFGYPGVCYPGGTDFASAAAAPLRLVPGQQAQLEISLTRQPFYPVSISVASAEHSAPQVFDYSGRPAGFAMRSRNQGGSYEVSLPNGRYYAEVQTWEPTHLYGRLDFTVAGAPLSGLTLVPAPARTIAVEVHTEFTANPDRGSDGSIQLGILQVGGRPVADVQPNINLNWTAADKPLDGTIGANLRRSENSSSDLYETDAPPQGSYWIEALPRFNSYVSSITSGGTDLLREPLTIGPGSSGAPIEITLRNDTGQLECATKAPGGLVSGDNSVAEDAPPAFVYALPQFPSQQRIYQSVAQIQSSLSLPPGKYLVVAFDQAHEIDLDDPEEISRLTAHGQTVTIVPGATTQVQLDPIPVAEEAASQ